MERNSLDTSTDWKWKACAELISIEPMDGVYILDDLVISLTMHESRHEQIGVLVCELVGDDITFMWQMQNLSNLIL